MYTEVNQQVARFAMRGDRMMFVFIFKDDGPLRADNIQAQKALLRKRFETSGWECPQILERSMRLMISILIASARSGWVRVVDLGRMGG
jgi:hypothetical protein